MVRLTAYFKGECMSYFNLKTSVLLAALAVSACAGETERQTITVRGVGIIETEPDRFTAGMTVVQSAQTSVEALERASAQLAELDDRLRRLEGLEWIEITTSEAAIAPVFNDEDCRSYTRPAGCRPDGYQVTVALAVEASPADLAGNLLSYASELGARNSRLSGFSVSDPEQQYEMARLAAVEDAHRQAAILAGALDMGILDPTLISYGDEYRRTPPVPMIDYDHTVSEIMPLESPSAELNLSPSPRVVREEVVVEFELEARAQAR